MGLLSPHNITYIWRESGWRTARHVMRAPQMGCYDIFIASGTPALLHVFYRTGLGSTSKIIVDYLAKNTIIKPHFYK